MFAMTYSKETTNNENILKTILKAKNLQEFYTKNYYWMKANNQQYVKSHGYLSVNGKELKCPKV